MSASNRPEASAANSGDFPDRIRDARPFAAPRVAVSRIFVHRPGLRRVLAAASSSTVRGLDGTGGCRSMNFTFTGGTAGAWAFFTVFTVTHTAQLPVGVGATTASKVPKVLKLVSSLVRTRAARLAATSRLGVSDSNAHRPGAWEIVYASAVSSWTFGLLGFTFRGAGFLSNRRSFCALMVGLVSLMGSGSPQ